jgi:hypothetical protein
MNFLNAGQVGSPLRLASIHAAITDAALTVPYMVTCPDLLLIVNEKL